MCVAALCAESSVAAMYEKGDFMYTPNGRFQITSDNLVTNGDFSDGTNGWLNYADEELSIDTFSVTADGPDGGTALTLETSAGVKSTNYATSSNFHQFVQLEENTTYVCTYKTRAFTTPRICSTVMSGGRSDNHQSFHISTSNTQLPTAATDDDYALVLDNIFTFSTIYDEWTERTMDYTADSSVYVVISFYNLIEGDAYTDFGIYEAKQIGDDREAQDIIDEIDFFLNLESFEAGDDDRATLQEAREELESYIGTDIGLTDLDDIMEAIEGEGGPLQSFLDANSADLSGYYTNFTFDDCSTGSKTVAAGWSAPTTDRWGVTGEAGNLGTNHVYASIGCNYALDGNSMYQSAELPAGTYLYGIRAMSHKYMTNGSDNYLSDYIATIDSMTYFINDDTIMLEDIQTSYANLYLGVFEVTEDGAQTIGFSYPTVEAASCADYDGHAGAGIVHFDNVLLRSVGKTSEEVEAYFLSGVLETSQEALKAVIDSAETVVDDDTYCFGKDDLQEVIDMANSTYTTLTDATQEGIDSLDAVTDDLEDAIDAYYTINNEYVTLGEDIATCEENVADENRPSGKETFQSAIDVAKAYYEAQTADSRDSAELVRQDETLMDARQVYMIANASQTTPGEINLVNNSFQTLDDTGWTQDGSTDNSKWKFSNNSKFTDGSCINYWRGTTANDYKYVYQDVEVENSGVYLYTAELICTQYSWTDTTSKTTDRYIFVNTDSVMVISVGSGDSSDAGEPESWHVLAKIEDINALDNPGTLRVGFTRAETTSQKLAIIYFGSSHLYYLGSIADFDEDTFDPDIVGIKEVTADSQTVAGNGDVYTLSGVKVRGGAGTLKGLEKGIYIMNGKKYVVK